MKLLPNRFKRLGRVLCPTGFVLWTFFQSPVSTRFYHAICAGSPESCDLYHGVMVFLLTTTFFSALAGLYFIAFSKEKVEDEMIRQLRLESFQFAASVQLIAITVALMLMAFFGEPEAEGLMMFFVAGILLFWLCFIFRFRYTLRKALK